MREFTPDGLAKYNGKDRDEIYVAYKGNVYDVTNSELWMAGDHQGMHEGGIDLTEEMEEAPHEEDVFNEFEIIGIFVNNH
ncbi:cytochrome b5 domain-containing protein [Methanohalophilus portucalensis]|uniref:Cytochrome b5 n=2 Tax=Methanohalophilus portucalensis TaxID=39664 RepID=A0A1L9C3D8_9EURY|nr:cytochrome b5 domain-containing protein [Methanohalophilus portucalensis]ATU07487.1 cytochrome B5 [Methanohalophilus portucalensis]OJH49045.1 cytochrome b5 [Methanohalophilus portucalensis FDF-1]RNI10216.1 cytochrome B5 [Methanohalophilus portucalensis FDF-1]SMH38878.1 Predicted heme/steroid binding protein [Methanohalophilus portucalensis FDF-1]